MTIKQLITYVRLLWKTKMLDVKLLQLDTHRLKVTTEAYKIKTMALKNPEIAELAQKYDPDIWEEFNIQFSKLYFLGDYVKTLKKWEEDMRGKNTGNPQT